MKRTIFNLLLPALFLGGLMATVTASASTYLYFKNTGSTELYGALASTGTDNTPNLSIKMGSNTTRTMYVEYIEPGQTAGMLISPRTDFYSYSSSYKNTYKIGWGFTQKAAFMHLNPGFIIIDYNVNSTTNPYAIEVSVENDPNCETVFTPYIQNGRQYIDIDSNSDCFKY